MKKIVALTFNLILSISLSGQTIRVSDKLILTQLTDKTYIHTSENNNGLVFISGGNSLIVSTPDSDNETQNLINWVRNEKKTQIIAYVIDRWHPDAMEGLDIIHKNGIESYSYELTQVIAKEKGLPAPQIGFDPKREILVGNERVICHYLGEAHTKDGVVVWIPSEQILFGGNEIRSFNGWVGNIGDAILYNWSETATRIKNEYSSAKVVIPGHGRHGGVELIDYTIKLYEKCKKDTSSSISDILFESKFKTNEDFYFMSESDSIVDGIQIFMNAIAIAQDSTKYVKIGSPQIIYKPDEDRIESEVGGLTIYDKTINGEKLRTDISYKRLIVFKKNDSVGLRVILRALQE